MKITAVAAKPFAKWVGGKRQLLKEIQQRAPFGFADYYEPFVGGGAVFFNVNYASSFHINDINTNLINAYIDIRDSLERVVFHLSKIEKEYLSKTEAGRKKYFYKMRDDFNSARKSTKKSALLIALNRTCFNGMYRENSKGEFNVPHGRHKNPTICDEANLQLVSQKLQNTLITNTDFKTAVKTAKKSDFVYFDPPYVPLNITSNFTDYHKSEFGEKQQLELAELFAELDSRGCFVMLSNSNTDFVREKYKQFNIHEVRANRSINSKADGRGKIKELIVVNYR